MPIQASKIGLSHFGFHRKACIPVRHESAHFQLSAVAHMLAQIASRIDCTCTLTRRDARSQIWPLASTFTNTPPQLQPVPAKPRQPQTSHICANPRHFICLPLVRASCSACWHWQSLIIRTDYPSRPPYQPSSVPASNLLR